MGVVLSDQREFPKSTIFQKRRVVLWAFWPTTPHPLWKLFLGRIILLCVRCHLNYFQGLSGINQVGQKAQITTLHIWKIANFGEFPSGLREPHPLWKLFQCKIILSGLRCHLNYFWSISGDNQVGQKAQITRLNF